VSIVRYSKEHSVSETGSVSVLRGGGTPTLLGPLERANLSHWAPSPEDGKTLCSLEYQTMVNAQKPSHPDGYTG
jgi:hypothetical protein